MNVYNHKIVLLKWISLQTYNQSLKENKTDETTKMKQSSPSSSPRKAPETAFTTTNSICVHNKFQKLCISHWSQMFLVKYDNDDKQKTKTVNWTVAFSLFLNIQTAHHIKIKSNENLTLFHVF